MKSNINQTPLRTYSEIPKKWELRPDVFGDYSKLTKDHYKDGWRDYIAPQIGENQRRGERYHDKEKDIVTERLIDLTAEEIKARERASLLADESAQKLATDISNGQAMYQKFFAHIQRQFDKGNLTANQARNSVTLLWLPLLPINYGQFIVAQINLNALTPPVNAKELAILTLAKLEISEYLAR